MWRLEKMFTFEASHMLPHHKGKCARLHGHSWKCTLVCEGSRLQGEGPSEGMLIDYEEMSRVSSWVRENYLDHRHLNDIPGMINPTSEEVARWIYEQLKVPLPMLVEVVVDETCTSRCVFRPSKIGGDVDLVVERMEKRLKALEMGGQKF